MFNNNNDSDDSMPPLSDRTSVRFSGADNAKFGSADNRGALIVDATCVPINIQIPAKHSLFNEAREKLETIMYRFCKFYSLAFPRRYAKKDWKAHLAYRARNKDVRFKTGGFPKRNKAAKRSRDMRITQTG